MKTVALHHHPTPKGQVSDLRPPSPQVTDPARY